MIEETAERAAAAAGLFPRRGVGREGMGGEGGGEGVRRSDNRRIDGQIAAIGKGSSGKDPAPRSPPQMGKSLGAHVVGVCSGKNVAGMWEAGADQVLLRLYIILIII